MKLIFVCSEYPPAPHGGIGVFTKKHAESLARVGWRVAVIGLDASIKKSTFTLEEGVEVYRIYNPYYHKKRLRIGKYFFTLATLRERLLLSKSLKQLAKNFLPDIIESYEWFGPLWEKTDYPLVVRLHGSHTINNMKPSFILKYFEKINLGFANSIVGISKHVVQRTQKAFKLEKTCTVIYNGVDTDHFKCLALEKNIKEVLYVGRLHPVKGVYELFKTMSSVFERDREVKLKIIGNDSNKSLKDSLLKIIPEIFLQNIVFLGNVPHHELVEHYNKATLCVVPSRAEAFGLTCVEAMACETVVLMTNRGSGPEIIPKNLDYLLVDIEDVHSFSEKILRLLGNKKLRDEISKKLRSEAVQRFNAKTILNDNLKFYLNMVKDIKVEAYNE